MPDTFDIEKYDRGSIRAFAWMPADDERSIEELEGVAKKWFSDMENTKWIRALQWFENDSYLQGNHLTRYYYSASTGFGFASFSADGSSIPPQGGFDQLVAKSADNRLIRPVETVTGMLVQARPKPRVVPNSDSPEDEDAAAISQIFVNVTFEHPLDIPRLKEQAALISCICGTVAAEVEYGPTDTPITIPKFSEVERPNPLYDPEAPETEDNAPTIVDVEASGEEEVTFKNDFQARLWTPFHLFPDPAATDESDMKWIRRVTFEDRDWIVENFTGERDEGFIYSDPDRLRDAIGTSNILRNSLYWWYKFQDIIESPQYSNHGGGLSAPTYALSTGHVEGQVNFDVLDVKPSRQYPRGRTLIFAGGTLIWVGDARAWSAKYPKRWHPYAFHRWFHAPGKFWGVALLSQLVPLQKKINAIDAQVHANRQFMSIGQWKIPRHAKVADGYISGIPGQHLYYTDAPGLSAPERVQHTALPGELLQERAQLIAAIDYIASSGLVGEQVSPGAARAGVILNFLREDRLRSKAPMLQSFERFIEKIGQNLLIEAQRGLIEDDPELTARIAAAAREFSSLSIETFTGASIRDHTNVVIDIASEVLDSPEARAQRGIEFLQARGAAATPQEVAMAMRAANLDEFARSEEDASIARARRMISRVVSGMLEAALPMEGIDVAKVMAPVFQRELLSERFINYPPDVKQALFGLFDHYSQKAAEEQQRALQMQLAFAQAAAAAKQSATKPQGGSE